MRLGKIVSMFPDYWKTSVTVRRGGGRDDWGNPKPAKDFTVEECLVSWHDSSEPNRMSEVSNDTAYLFRDPDPSFRFQSTDSIVVPESASCPGTWVIDGQPKEEPMGVKLVLKKR